MAQLPRRFRRINCSALSMKLILRINFYDLLGHENAMCSRFRGSEGGNRDIINFAMGWGSAMSIG